MKDILQLYCSMNILLTNYWTRRWQYIFAYAILTREYKIMERHTRSVTRGDMFRQIPNRPFRNCQSWSFITVHGHMDYIVRWQSDLENTKERPLHKPSQDQSKSTALGGVWNFAERCIPPYCLTYLVDHTSTLYRMTLAVNAWVVNINHDKACRHWRIDSLVSSKVYGMYVPLACILIIQKYCNTIDL